MKIKERLNNIPELNIAKYLANIPDDQIEDYEKKLSEFVDIFPTNEAELRNALEKQDVEAITGFVKNLSDILTKIYAEELASECLKHVSTFEKLTFERVKAYVTYLLTTLAALSIDIQMAIFMDEHKESADVKKPPESKSPAALDASNEEKIILAVDDDAFCLDMLKVALKDLPYKVIGVTSGEGALDILEKYNPILFILDIDMPFMSGIELAGKIKKLGFSEPIVFITGNVDKSYVVSAVKAGGLDFILKPIKHQNVVKRIKKFL